MKFHWGHGIILCLGLACLFFISLGIRMVSKPTDILTSDYYSKGIQYEQQIQLVRNTETHSVKPFLNWKDNRCEIQFRGNVQSGTIQFYRPNDPTADWSLEIPAGNSPVVKIPTEKLYAGFWRAKINWSDGKTGFYHEESFRR